MFGLRRFAIERPVIFWSFVLGSIGKCGTACILFMCIGNGEGAMDRLQKSRESVLQISTRALTLNGRRNTSAYRQKCYTMCESFVDTTKSRTSIIRIVNREHRYSSAIFSNDTTQQDWTVLSTDKCSLCYQLPPWFSSHLVSHSHIFLQLKLILSFMHKLNRGGEIRSSFLFTPYLSSYRPCTCLHGAKGTPGILWLQGRGSTSYYISS